MDVEVLSTKEFFKSRKIVLADEWLQSCIQWFHEEEKSPYTNQMLHFKVYEQWLLLDLRDVEVPILPLNLRNQAKVVLNEVYSLQMLNIVDISRPKYSQLSKVRTKNLINITELENESMGTVKRVLQLTLTDGVQEVQAVEYFPIPILNVNLTPGVKVRIIGPVVARRGQIFLEEQNIKILGGEVEELLVCNAAENVLARFLKMPENPTPSVIAENFAMANTDILRTVRNPPNLKRQNVNTNSSCDVSGRDLVTVSINSNQLDSFNRNHLSSSSFDRVQPNFSNINFNEVPASTLNNHRKSPTGNIPKPAATCTTSNVITEEEELKIFQEVDMLLGDERTTSVTSSYPKRALKTPDIFEESDLDEDVLENVNQLHFDQIKTPAPLLKMVNKEQDVFMDVDAQLNIIDLDILEIPATPMDIITSISNLLNRSKKLPTETYTICARFKQVLEKLEMTEDAWTLKLLVKDNTGDIPVRIHSDVVSSLIGYTPAAVMDLRNDMLNNDEHAKITITKALQRLKDELMNLDCKMEIMFKEDEEVPIICKLNLTT